MNNDELNLLNEKKELEDNYKASIKELKNLSSFLKKFMKLYEEMGEIYQNKDNLIENKKEKNKEEKQNKTINETLKNTDSFLFPNMKKIYDSFDLLKNAV